MTVLRLSQYLHLTAEVFATVLCTGCSGCSTLTLTFLFTLVGWVCLNRSVTFPAQIVTDTPDPTTLHYCLAPHWQPVQSLYSHCTVYTHTGTGWGRLHQLLDTLTLVGAQPATQCFPGGNVGVSSLPTADCWWWQIKWSRHVWLLPGRTAVGVEREREKLGETHPVIH